MSSNSVPERLLDEGWSAYQENAFDAAMAKARAIAPGSVHFGEASLLLAQCLLATGASEEAERVLAAAPEELDVLKSLARLRLRLGRAEGALQAAEKGLAIATNDVELLAYAGQSLGALSRWEESLVRLDRAAKRAPESAPIHDYRGFILANLNRIKPAIEALRRAIALAPTAPSPRRNLAKVLLAAGRPAEAIATLEPLPNDSVALRLLAQALIAADRADSAEPTLKRLLKLNPDDPETRTMYGYWLQSQGRFDEARDQFELTRGSAAALYGIAQGRQLNDSDRSLLAQLDEALVKPEATDEERMAVQYARGKAQEDFGEFDLAADAYEEANRLAFKVNLSSRPFRRAQYEKLVDETIALYSPDFISQHRLTSTLPPLPILVVGMMRSGTTLLEQILSSHPDVVGAGERDYWLDHRHTEVRSERLLKLSEGYYRELREAAPNAARVIDKMPQNFQVLGLIHLALPEVPIVHMRRDPVDTCLSIYTTPYQMSPEFAHDLGSIAFAYRQYMRLMEHWRKTLPPAQFLEIEYEELVQDPEPVLRRVTTFCSLDWNDALLHHESNQRTVTTPSMWQVRQPLYGSSIGRKARFPRWEQVLRQELD